WPDDVATPRNHGFVSVTSCYGWVSSRSSVAELEMQPLADSPRHRLGAVPLRPQPVGVADDVVASQHTDRAPGGVGVHAGGHRAAHPLAVLLVLRAEVQAGTLALGQHVHGHG